MMPNITKELIRTGGICTDVLQLQHHMLLGMSYTLKVTKQKVFLSL